MNKNLIKITNVPELVLELTGISRSRQSIYNWVKNGRTIYGGEKIKLKTTKSLGFICTTREWIQEFLEKL